MPGLFPPTPWLRAGLCALVLLSASASAQAPGDVRIALVIGNAAYPDGAALGNPGNDATAMATALKGLGFKVVEVRDGKREQMAQAITTVRDQLQGKQGVGMLYYAGHGVQYDWRNFMVPVDARLQDAADIPAQTVDVGGVLDAFKAAGNRLNLVVLDACRDNPFDNKLATKGLAPVDAPPGTYMAFATTPGNVAADGDDQTSANGLYTRFLLQELQKPLARVEDVFKRVRLQVRLHSGGRQIPSDSSNLDEAFSFDTGFAKAQLESASLRQQRYDAEKAAWDRIKASRQAADFFGFLQRYPNGFISEMAQFRADQLQRPLLVTQRRRDGITALASGTNRYAQGDQYTLLTTDLLTGIVRRDVQTVTFADNNRVEINGGVTVYDQMGALVSDDSGVKDPPTMMVPADISLGKRWSASFVNRIAGYNARVNLDFKTVALEELDIPGARIKTYKVDIDGFANVGGANGHFTGTLWIEPTTMRLVRYDRMLRGGNRIADSSSQVVVDYIPAPR
ncbi:MAG: caspase family protein [Pseudomonadota bacterium]